MATAVYTFIQYVQQHFLYALLFITESDLGMPVIVSTLSRVGGSRLGAMMAASVIVIVRRSFFFMVIEAHLGSSRGSVIAPP